MAMSERNRTEAENWLTTERPSPKENSSGQFLFVFFRLLLPLVVLAVCMSAMIYYALKKKKLDELRHRLVPFYKFDPAECEDEWQTELLEDTDGSEPIIKIQDYKSTDYVTDAGCRDVKSYV